MNGTGFPLEHDRDWGVDRRRPRAGAAWAWTGILVVGILVLGAAGYAVGAVPGAAAAALAWAGVCGGWVATTRKRIIRAVGARQLEGTEQARLTNLCRGLASDLGIPAPSLWLVPDPAPNALIWGGGHRSNLGVTQGLVDSCTRTQLEAVVAHCLVRLDSRATDRMRVLAAALGPFGRAMAPRVGYEDDVRAAALTQYPPALARAVEIARPATGASGGVWFVADEPPYRSPEERIKAISDL